MPVDDEVAIRSVLILAHACFEERGILHRRKSKAKIFTYFFQAFHADEPLAQIRIEFAPATIVRYFEPSPLISRNSVNKRMFVVRPRGEGFFREPGIPRRRAEEEHILLCRANLVADRVREEFSHPGPTGEYVLVGRQLRAVCERKALLDASLQVG